MKYKRNAVAQLRADNRGRFTVDLFNIRKPSVSRVVGQVAIRIMSWGARFHSGARSFRACLRRPGGHAEINRLRIVCNLSLVIAEEEIFAG
ncbi:MAG: hypothetical protein JWM99_274 [Verrucomicrobiales bacterium]|nr:hypothetical protein [Verrucomicrobiales bacterium]